MPGGGFLLDHFAVNPAVHVLTGALVAVGQRLHRGQYGTDAKPHEDGLLPAIACFTGNLGELGNSVELEKDWDNNHWIQKRWVLSGSELTRYSA